MKVFTYIYAIGAAQGLILAIALFRKKTNKRSNRVLATWMLFLLSDLLMKVVYLNNPQTEYLSAYAIIQFFPFLYGTFYYLYVRSIATDKVIKISDLIHFSGFIFVVLVSFEWIINPHEIKNFIYTYYDFLLYIYSVSYVIAGLLTIRRYRKLLEQQQSNTDGISLIWIDVMAYFQVLIWFIAVTQSLMQFESYNFWIIYVAVAIWMTVTGYLALSQQDIKLIKQIEKPKSIDDSRFSEVDDKLQNLMNSQQIYLEPSLNIGQVAKKSGYPEYLVSLVINQVYNQTFREYINELRIKAATAALIDKNDQRTILDIAYDCGFTSKSTFNSAFKRINNMTPSEFRSQQQQTSSV